MSKITLYGFAGSTYVQTARLVCLEARQEYALEPLEFGKPSHAALHPFLKMPVMRDGEMQLFESLAIATYICENNTSGSLIPGGMKNRCEMYSWVSAAIDYLYPALVSGPLAKNIDMPTCGNYLSILNNNLEDKPWMAGPEISLADLFIFPMVAFIEKQAPCDGERPFKKLDNWLDALKQREGYLEIINDG